MIPSRCFAAVLLVSVTYAPSVARAQACCAGALGSAGVRLRIFDRAALQLDVGADRELGLWDDGRAFNGSDGVLVLDFRQTMSGALRVPFLPRLELSAQVPFQEGHRATVQTSEWGSGAGDASLGARYTFVEAGEHGWPGLGIVVGGLLPTGRPSQASTGVLGADVTGRGTYRYGLEFWAERSNLPLYFAVVPGIANTPQPASLGGGNELELSGRLIAGWTFSNDVVLASSLQMIYAPPRVDDFGEKPPKYRPSVTVAAAVPFGESWLVQASAGADVPLSSIGRNETSQIRGQIGFRYAFLSDD